MKLTLQMKVMPDTDQKPILLSTMERFNQAASFAAKVGFEAGVSSQPSIHNRCYAEIRQRFGLSAQMAVRAIGKAVETFAALKAKGRRECPIFRLFRRICGCNTGPRLSSGSTGGSPLPPSPSPRPGD